MTTSSATRRTEYRLLQVYLIYRLALAVSLLVIYFAAIDHDNPPSLLTPYPLLVIAYGTLCLATLALQRSVGQHLPLLTTTVVITDIMAIAALDFSEGIKSDLTVLLIVTIAAGSIQVRGRTATFFAAVATLVILYKETVAAWRYSDFYSPDLFQSALIGTACFATALLAHLLARRLRESTELASRQAKDLASLEELNHLIIQRMRTGIMVVDGRQRIILANDSSRKLLSSASEDATLLDAFSPQLAQEFSAWQQDKFYRARPFQGSETGPEVQVSFTRLNTGVYDQSLIFVEDNTRLAQHAQQLKLASLGGLTASIAHEIRNPLGAISHAAQLLQESPSLDTSDQRLTDIIYQHSARMNQIIENVLQLSRRSASNPQLLNLSEWLPRFLEDFMTTQPDKPDIQLQCPPIPLLCRADPSQLYQVLSNLCANGIRYSLAHSNRPSLTISASEDTLLEQPFIDVQDDGAGVPAELKDKIFEPFYTSEKSGTGLGLYMAKELCEANQARLDLLPAPHGARFRITFSHPARIQTL